MMGWLSRNVFHPLWDMKEGSDRLRTLRKLMATQWLPESELYRRQWQRVREILVYAYVHSDYYRALFDTQRIRPEAITPENFAQIPLLTKKLIQDQGDRLLSREYRKDVLIHAKTGGSTGKSLHVYSDRHWQIVRTADALRSNRWAGWDIGMKVAAIWGNPVVPDDWRSRLRNALRDRTIYLDTMNLSPATMTAFVEQWHREKPDIIFGHSHSIFILARFLRDRKITGLHPKGIVVTSMMLIPQERATIEAVFHCKVTDRYGCEEVGLIASECERHHGMHLDIEHLYIEFLDDEGQPAVDGQDGQIVVTDLFNHGMPMIRYRVEDVGVPTSRKCPCGRGLPMMERVTGRTADFLVRPDGSLVAGVSLVERTLTAIRGIEQMQLVQEKPELLRVNLVVRNGYDSDGESALRREFHQVFGPGMALELCYLDGIPQERSGKYRFSICKIQ